MSEPDATSAGAELPAAPVVTFETDGCVMGHWRDVIIVVWGVDVTAALLEEYAKLLADVASTQPRFSVVHIAPKARPLPSGDLRTAFAAVADKYADQLLLTGVLIVGGGFWASAVRSMITSVQVITRRKLNVRVCGSADEVVTWLALEHSAKTGTQLHEAPLMAAVDLMLDRPSVRGLRATPASLESPR